MKSIVVNPIIVRKYPNPLNLINGEEIYNIEHLVAICQANELSDSIPFDPNPRAQRTDKSIYKKVKGSLLSEQDPTFMLKNKGITIIAGKVTVSDDKKELTMRFGAGEGIVDGGHTYRIIQESKSDCPDNQYVRLEILTGLPKDMYEDIAEGLNTAVQVQQMSLANLAHKFDWIKDTLNDKPYARQIAFKENEDGKFDARDIVALITLFNIDLYPEMSNTHPKVAYTSKAKCLEDFINETKNPSFRKVSPILDDILHLYDYINIHSHELYNKKFKGKGASLAIYQNRKRGLYSWVFSGNESKIRLYDGALFPILAAFRFLVEQKKGSNRYSWKLGSFKKVLSFVDEICGDLINITKITSESRGRNPNAIGKDDNHWAYLYQTVAYAFLQIGK